MLMKPKKPCTSSVPPEVPTTSVVNAPVVVMFRVPPRALRVPWTVSDAASMLNPEPPSGSWTVTPDATVTFLVPKLRSHPDLSVIDALIEQLVPPTQIAVLQGSG